MQKTQERTHGCDRLFGEALIVFACRPLNKRDRFRDLELPQIHRTGSEPLGKELIHMPRIVRNGPVGAAAFLAQKASVIIGQKLCRRRWR